MALRIWRHHMRIETGPKVVKGEDLRYAVLNCVPIYSYYADRIRWPCSASTQSLF
jgi:hypothetical protein